MTDADLSQLLGHSLVAHDSSNKISYVPSTVIRGKTIGLYFSAHWCPPCRQFTPLLVQVYRKLHAKGKELEVVFVSSDKNQQQFQEYFQDMPWKGVPFEDALVRKRLSQHFKVMGIPTLVLVGPDGRVLTHNGRAAVMRDREGAEFPWEGSSTTRVSCCCCS